MAFACQSIGWSIVTQIKIAKAEKKTKRKGNKNNRAARQGLHLNTFLCRNLQNNEIKNLLTR